MRFAPLLLLFGFVQSEKSLNKQFTKLFGLKDHVTNATTTYHTLNKGTPPAFLMSLYEKLKTLDNESQQKVLSDGNTVRAIYPIKVERVDDNVIWIYDVSALPRTEIVVTSEFRAQTTDEIKLKIDKGNVINVKMMKRVTPKTEDEQEMKYRTLRYHTVFPRSSIWTSSNIKKLIEQSRSPGYILTVTVNGINESQNFLPLLVLYSNDVEQDESLKKPLEELVRRKRSQLPTGNVKTETERKSNRSSRRKKSKRCRTERESRRRSGKRHRTRKECKRQGKRVKLVEHISYKSTRSHQCGRRSLQIDFNEIGWSSWIIQPMTFDAFYCSGRCNYYEMRDVNRSNHAMLQAIMNGFYPEIPLPCCVPDRMMPLSILFTDHQNHVVLKLYPEMSVQSCSCR